MKVRSIGWVTVAALVLTVARAKAQDLDAGIALGTIPPAVTLPDLDGKPVDLSGVVGKKPVLLEFWATWCPLCRALMPRIDAARARLGDKMEFLAIGVGVNQTPASIKRHIAQHPIPLKILFDATGAAVRAYDAPTTSYVVVLDAQGKVVYTGVGEEQDIEAAVAKAFPKK